MATSSDCKQIEKCIKDMIFRSSAGNEPFQQTDLNRNLNPNAFSIDDRCLVSNIENMPEKPKVKSSHPPGTSELIDFNVLTNFAAKHIADSSFGPSQLVLTNNEIILPHPDLEDDCPVDMKNGHRSDTGISNLLNSISNEIQNSPNFLSMPENPLPQVIGTPKKTRKKPLSTGPLPDKKTNVSNSKKLVDDEKFHQKKKRGQRKLVKERKRKERMDGLYVQKDGETDIKTEVLKEGDNQANSSKNGDVKIITRRPIAEEAIEEPGIKLKKNPLSEISQEYSIIFQEDQYRFQCALCNYNSDLKDAIIKHVNSKSHRALKTQNDLDMMLPFLPEPLAKQTETLTELLNKIVLLHGLTKEERNMRDNLSLRLQKFVKDSLSTCSVEPIGSSATGCVLKDSEIDFVLRVPSDDNIPDCLENLYLLMKSKGDTFSKVLNDFKKKRPCIKFIDCETMLPCNIKIDTGSSLKLAQLLGTYFELDDRALTLGIAVKFWAKLCEIDQQDLGTFPSFCHALFMVHFLQQVQPPVLPVLHEVKDYASAPEFYKEYLSENRWKSENTDSVGELWLKFFRFYNFEYKLGFHVVCIRSSKRAICKDRNWSTKFYAVEDPFLRRNLAYVIPTFQVCSYIERCFRRTYKYFAYPQLKSGSIKLMKTDSFDALKLTEYVSNKSTLKEDDSDESEESGSEDYDQLNAIPDLEDHDPDLPVEQFIAAVANISLDESKDANTDELTIPLKVSSDSVEPTTESTLTSAKTSEKTVKDIATKTTVKANNEVICYWDLKGIDIKKELFQYEFRAVAFKGEKPVPLICKLCKGNGHQKKDCPVDDLPIPHPLPRMTPEFLEVVTNTLFGIREKFAVSKAELNFINANMCNVQSYIREVFPDATLKLFGSFCNGFGFRSQSDMDFCLTFGDRDDGKDLDSVEVIEKIAKELRRHPELINVLPITSAKVPIVKFSWANNGLEGDISLYNTLALVNTELLEAYSKIDERVQVLGYAFKHFAKVLGICDASRGSLSSYAYILMVIFFLQQRNPPVIPVLQELHDGDKPERLIENWNVWFYREIQNLEQVWPDYGKNKETIGELWLGLLSFYTCDFNWKEYVISIKQKSPLTRFRKLWVTNQLAIEDPFDLNHNLGAGLSRKMNTYILKSFIRARERFGTPVSFEKIKPGNEQGYLFNRNFLNSGMEPPQDRGCGNCGKIGHIAKNCPQEKTCSYCRQPGHLIKNCPKKGRGKKSRDRDRNYQYAENQNLDRRDNNDKHNPRGQNQKAKNEYHLGRTFPGMQQQPSSLESQKFIQLGVPTHRMPPPNFNRNMIQNKQSTFNNSFPPAQVQGNFPPSFSIKHPYGTPPFPRGGKKGDMHSQSPPKHFSSSPPKNFSPKAPFHPLSISPWPQSRPGFNVERHPAPQLGRNMPAVTSLSRNLNIERHSVPQSVQRNMQQPAHQSQRILQLERHPNPQAIRNPPNHWQGRPMVQRDQYPVQRDHHSVHPNSNHSHNLDHRLHRSNSDSNSYNSNHTDRW